MMKKTNLAQLIEKHQALDFEIENKKERFLSDWNGTHPFIEQFLGTKLKNSNLKNSLPSRYIYYDEEHKLMESICSYHQNLESLSITKQNVVAGSGSSSLLVAFSLWLLQNEYEEIYYIPPLYYTFHYFLKTLNIRLRPVTGTQLFETNSKLNLPNKRTVLLMCDPIWYAGYKVPSEKINLITTWQRKTNSIVFIDGSFQYMQWNQDRFEATSALNPELTFRLISPTKSLAIPFYRFAYLLHPSQFHEEFVFLYESLIGGASITDLIFAYRALKVLSSKKSNLVLTNYLKETYEELLKQDLIQTQITPECGYFVFVVPNIRLPDQVGMDQSYFELKRYPNYFRINLLSARNLYLTK